MSFNFWQKWLVGVGVYHVLFGLLLAFFVQSHVMDMVINQYYDPFFWTDQDISAGTLRYKNWMNSVMGAVVASWGCFIAFLAYYPFKAREKWAWNCITTSVLLWFVIDTGCSIYYGVTINAVFNFMTVVLFLFPLFFTYKAFHQKDA